MEDKDNPRDKSIVAFGAEFSKQEWVVALERASGSQLQGREIRGSRRADVMVDLVFVVDTTGSMSGIIEGLLVTCGRFADELSSSAFDSRIAIIAFGDLTVTGDRVVKSPFMRDPKGVKQLLAKTPRFSGGGNQGESAFEALEVAWSLEFREGAIRVLALLTDEPALMNRLSPSEIVIELRRRECLTFVASPPLSYYKELARATGGVWQPIGDDTSLRSILESLQLMASRIRTVVSDVQRIGDGKVSSYLSLKGKD